MNSSNFVWWLSAALALPIGVTIAFSPPVLPVVLPPDAFSGLQSASSTPVVSATTSPLKQSPARPATPSPQQPKPQVPPTVVTPLPTTTPPQSVPPPTSSPQPATPSVPTSTPNQNPSPATSTPATSTPSTPAPVAGSVPEGYALAFSDEFDGASLNRTKWKTRYIYADGTLDFLNDEQQRYRDGEHHVVSNGTLKLVATKAHTDGRYAAYESGMIRSTHTLRYGYIEARVKLPDGKGVWPAFWLNPDRAEDGALKWPPEIDIFEYVVNGREELPDMLHMGVISHGAQGHSIEYRDRNFNRQWSYYKNPRGSLAGEWHVIGALWDEKGVTIYLDEKKIVTFGYKWVYDDGKEAAPAHILLNFAIGGSWAGKYGVDDSRFPQTFEIDYVRAYEPSS